MTMRLRLSRSDLLTLGGIPYRPVEVLADAITLERADQPGITQSFTHSEVHALLRSSDTRYQAGYFDFARSRDRKNRPVDMVMDLEDETRSIVLWRQAVCDSVLKLEQEDRVARTYASVDAILPTLDYEVRRRSGQNGTRAGTALAPSKTTCRTGPCFVR